MNYTIRHLKVRSSWFDEGGKFSEMGSEVFNTYLNLFKFRLHNQETRYHFMTSIQYLRKETGYTKQKTLDHLKLLSKLKIISINNINRWNKLLDENGNILECILLDIIATDLPKTTRVETDFGDKDQADSEEDYYVSVDLYLMNYYKDIGLNEKYYPIYCLIKRLSNNLEQKAFMSIENMALQLNYDKNTLNKLIKDMNRRYVLYSDSRKNGKGGYKYEHRLLRKYSDKDKFKSEMESLIQKNIAKWDKKKLKND